MTRGEEQVQLNLILTLIFTAVVIGGVVDIILDGPDQWLSVHVVFEVILVGLSLGSALYLGRGWYRSMRSVEVLEGALEERQAERDAWRESARQALEGLGAAIDRQLGEWQLTRTERETALAILKGLSHKTIAKWSGRSERTVRQHAVAVYRKSGLDGRAELSAFFLEGLLLPQAEQGSESPPLASP
jgi:DNA-binding CsgD family transcriptional regulator